METKQSVAGRTPQAMRHATNQPDTATASATTARHDSLKALARRALGCDNRRDNARNSAKTACDKSRSHEIVLPQRCRTRLMDLAASEGIDPALIHGMTAADLVGCTELPDTALDALLYARQDSTDRMAGRVPVHEAAGILCRVCGPVWASPEVAAALPIVDGWPHARGCPWCIVRAAGKYVPRPPSTCAACVHYQPDATNPDGGMGRCKCGYHYPNEQHACAEYRPRATPSKNGC